MTFQVSIMMMARTLTSPLHYLAFYEEFARRVPSVAAQKVPVNAPTPGSASMPAVLSSVAELEQERLNLEQRFVELRRRRVGPEAEHEVRRAIERNTDARLTAAERDHAIRTQPVTVFVSYAREDDPSRRRLYDHLGGLRAADRIKDWYDGEIVAGADWADEIRERMAAAEIILLLITPAFLGSNFIRQVELADALERHRRAEARVIPLIMRPAYWQGTDLGALQALPQDSKAVTSWDDQDAAMADIARGVDRVVKDVIATRT